MNADLYFNLWKFHPGKSIFPCDKTQFQNQCAIRMSVALQFSHIDLSSFSGAKCWVEHKDHSRHILRAQELANWMSEHPEIFGNKITYDRKKYPKLNHSDFWKMKGIIFFQDGWGPTDHIDIWNSSQMKGGENSYFTSNWKEIWFWQLL